MVFLAFSLSIFIVVHLIPAFPNAKKALITWLGRPLYIAAFSIFSVVSLGLIIYAKSQAPFVDVYEPPSWSRYFALTLMFPAVILIIASILPGYIGKITGSPIFYATLLWVIAHLVANGDEAAIVLFASLGVYACLSWFLMIKQSTVTGQTGKKAHFWADGAAVVAGAALYASLVFLHGDLIGVEIWY